MGEALVAAIGELHIDRIGARAATREARDAGGAAQFDARLGAQCGQQAIRQRARVDRALRHGEAPQIEVAKYPAPLREKAATFVTLRRDHRLRGCIGTVDPALPLAADAVANTFGAAFRDPRFDPLEPRELRGLGISVSILSPRRPLAYASERDLLERLRPGLDGLLLHNGAERGVFLPQVWESLPAAGDFLAHLKDKAGIDRALRPETDRAELFTAYTAGTVLMYTGGPDGPLHRYI